MTIKQTPRRADDIEASIQRLSGIINNLRPLAEQYEKLKAAAKGIKEAEQEVQALRRTGRVPGVLPPCRGGQPARAACRQDRRAARGHTGDHLCRD
ncbi:hypothetical protein D9X30_4851 [Cupriavidus sp. U2]|nr:hypothetical protein D9X30_4851 [Cupriavidus sp. U2]